VSNKRPKKLKGRGADLEKAKPVVEWKRRREIEITAVAKHSRRQSLCGLYRVVKWQGQLASTIGQVRFYAMYRPAADDHSWRILSEHQKEDTAKKACQEHARTSQRARQ
jgi:hypothetical protein